MRFLTMIVLMTATLCLAQAPVEVGKPSAENLQRDQFKVRKAFKTVIKQLDDLANDAA